MNKHDKSSGFFSFQQFCPEGILFLDVFHLAFLEEKQHHNQKTPHHLLSMRCHLCAISNLYGSTSTSGYSCDFKLCTTLTRFVWLQFTNSWAAWFPRASLRMRIETLLALTHEQLDIGRELPIMGSFLANWGKDQENIYFVISKYHLLCDITC